MMTSNQLQELQKEVKAKNEKMKVMQEKIQRLEGQSSDRKPMNIMEQDSFERVTIGRE